MRVFWMPIFKNVVPAEFEAWMENLALDGWQIDRLGRLSPIRMGFTKGESKKYRYVLDLVSFPTREYEDTYTQFGWESVGKMAGRHVWRKEYTDVRPESFTDTQSRIQRDKRVRNAALATLITCIAAAVLALASLAYCAVYGQFENIPNFVFAVLLSLLMISYFYRVVRKISVNIENLPSQG